jgi:hypothetical protein
MKELHAALMRHQETVVVFDQFGKAFETLLEKGLYKRMPNNPTRADGSSHEYCPPEHVASEMDRLIQLHREHEERGVGPHIESGLVPSRVHSDSSLSGWERAGGPGGRQSDFYQARLLPAGGQPR